MQAARARGRKGGRKPKMTPALTSKAQRMYDSRAFTMAEIAAAFDVTPMTVYRNIVTSGTATPAALPRASRPRAATTASAAQDHR